MELPKQDNPEEIGKIEEVVAGEKKDEERKDEKEAEIESKNDEEQAKDDEERENEEQVEVDEEVEDKEEKKDEEERKIEEDSIQEKNKEKEDEVEKKIEEIEEEIEELDDEDDQEQQIITRSKKNKGKEKKIVYRNFCVTVRCSMQKVGKYFGSSLPQSEKDNLKLSCFKYFLNIQTKELHMLISVVTEIVKHRVDILKYKIGGKEIQFKPLDVTLNLGLKIEALPRWFIFMETKVPSAFREKYFENRKSIKEKHILAALEKARMDKESGDDKHRLNRLLLLLICLLPETSKTVDLRYIDLAENLEKFDAFPWGTVVFELLQRALEEAAQHAKSGKVNFNFQGCVLAFIIWAYSHLPSLGPRREAEEPPFPRMLGWKNLPGKTTSRATIEEKIIPPRGKPIQVAPPFVSDVERNEELVIQAVMYQEDLDRKEKEKQKDTHIEGILQGLVKNMEKKIEKGVVSGLVSGLSTFAKKRAEVKKAEVIKKKKKEPTKPKPAPPKSKTVSKRKAITEVVPPPKSKKAKISTTPKTAAVKKGKVEASGKKLGSSPTPRTPTSDKQSKGKEKMTGSPPSSGKEERPLQLSLGNMRSTRSTAQKQLLTPPPPPKKQKVIPEPSRKQPPRGSKIAGEQLTWKKQAKAKEIKREAKLKQSDNEIMVGKSSLVETKNQTAKKKNEKKEEPKEKNEKEEMNNVMKEGDEEKMHEGNERKEQIKDVGKEGKEEPNILDVAMSEVQHLPILKGQGEKIKEGEDLPSGSEVLAVIPMKIIPEEYIVDIDGLSASDFEVVKGDGDEDNVIVTGEEDEVEDDNDDDIVMDEEAMVCFNNTQKRLSSKDKGKGEASIVDINLIRTMGMTFLDRNTTNAESDILDYYWDLNNNPSYEHKVMRVYGHGLQLHVKQFYSLWHKNWLHGDVIEAYINLIIRWYALMRPKISPENQYAIVESIYFATFVNGRLLPSFNRKMKDPTFAALTPTERVRSKRFIVKKNIRAYVSPTGHMLNQVPPYLSKALLIPCNVNKNHWVLFSFSFREGKLRIYDSLGGKKASPEQIGLEKMLSYVVFDADPSIGDFDLDFKWKREYVKCPQQKDGDSCGAFLLAYIDCIVRGRELNFNGEAELMRRRIAMDLVECGLKPPKKEDVQGYIQG